jgi:glutamate racemase
MALPNLALMDYDSRPIGIFDSGIGGVSVLNCFLQRFPNENYIYFGDTARLPYGNKSPETIRKYCDQILSFLASQNVKLIVVACNTASTQIHQQFYKSIPIIEMISAGIAQLHSVPFQMPFQALLLATRSTIHSGVYQERIRLREPEMNLTCIPCPLFVPLVEEGLIDHQITDQAIGLYLDAANVDWTNLRVIILGCTHYPFLQSSIQKYLSAHPISHLRFVDCGVGATDIFSQNKTILQNTATKGSVRIFLTDQSEYFQVILQRLVKIKIDAIQTVHL